MATIAAFRVPNVQNEPNKHYGPGSAERESLRSALAELRKDDTLEIPVVIGDREVRSSSTEKQMDPCNFSRPVANYHVAYPRDIDRAIDGALGAKDAWEKLPFGHRAAIFLKAADLVSGKYRSKIVAATMIGQGKNAWQAEIDAAAELCDFFRFNVKYAEELYAQQPAHNSPAVWNRVEYRPLEGFVYAISPFNFTAIGGNLPCLPALMGNVVIWKPSPSAVLSNYILYQILVEAGLPPHVIQFVPGDAKEITRVALGHKYLGGLHYTGSTDVFRSIYLQIASGIFEGRYLGYPRVVGETGGKNFHLIHRSADVTNAVVNTVRGAFEYQGQKCSAVSRVYVASSIWPEIGDDLIERMENLRKGPPDDFGNFIGPVIHKASFEKLAEVIDDANKDPDLELLVGGSYDGSKGYYIEPTIYRSESPDHKLFWAELFGPVVVLYVYADDKPDPDLAFKAVCRTIDETSFYGLTGAVFARDRDAIRVAEHMLRNAAGNFYINSKATGAVVGQQPFGGSRASGTNDKAGSMTLLSRFVGMRTIKEEFVESNAVEYPSNEP